MCGIAGVVCFNKTDSRKVIVEKMLNSIRHRGPDGFSVLDSPFGSIGHVRLSILDGSFAASQPFVDGHNMLSYNGEIYNYKELKSLLPSKDYSSYSDTEVLLTALDTWGVDKTISYSRGMFAFCWHNSKTGETYLVRDRFGIKPLFYCVVNGNEIYFSSELKSLLKVTSSSLNNFRTGYSILGGLERDGQRTAWDNIKQVPPGHYLRFNNGKIDLVRYFSVYDYINESDYNQLNHSSLDALTDQLDDLLGNAVNDMGMGDLPAGSFMSGGVDSGLISYYGKQSNKDIKLFSSDVDGEQSEAYMARLNAKAINSKLLTSTYIDKYCLTELVSTTWHYESPIVVHFNAVPLAGLSSLAKDMSTKAVLTGEGADELFVGYPHLIGGNIDAVLSFPYKLLDAAYNAFRGSRRFNEKKNFGASIQKSLRQAAEGESAPWSLYGSDAAYSFLPESDRVKHLQTAKMLNSHLLSLLWRNDRMGMMHSIESRFPFLDERVVRFAMNLPYKHKVSTVPNFTSWKHPFHSGKHLVRRLGSRYLPREIAFGQKKGFPVQGLNKFKIDLRFFENGFIQSLFQLDSHGLRHFFSGLDESSISLFSMVEIWGKLFVDSKSIEDVNSGVLRFFSYKA